MAALLLPDVNVLVHAHREDSPEHAVCAKWMREAPVAGASIAIVPSVLAGFLRIATHPGIFSKPSPVEEAIRFARDVLRAQNCVAVSAGTAHAEVFLDLCSRYKLHGNDTMDAHLAALAMEHAATVVTTDRGFARFREIRSKHPKDSALTTP